ncbi:MAG TPA: hypothetical protein VHO70_19170 [Chitinispirillaceae bacterium]|nr:hypothetical protein [Chitinispirillaceae bacterium]
MRKFLYVFLFIVKTVYFSPVNNPVFFCLIVISGVLFAGGEMNKHEVVLFLLLSAISHRLMPAINLSASILSGCQNGKFSQSIKLLPIKKNTFFVSFLLSGILYISLLLTFGYFAGNGAENPPVVESLCPPRMVTAYTPSGEPYRYVEGISVYGSKFQIPVSSSLLFQYLASDVVFSRDAVTEEYLQKVCPCQKIAPEKIFSATNQELSTTRFSPFLDNVRYSNRRILQLLCIFTFVFFLYDGMSIYRGRVKVRGLTSFVFVLVNVLLYSVYCLLCGMLIADVLLPESVIAKISLKVSLYKVVLPILLFAIAGCLYRLGSFLFVRENR